MKVLSLDTRAGSLLIPVSMVAQVLASSNQRLCDHRQPYISYEINWREYSMPLINGSEALGATPIVDEDYSRAVVLWPLHGFGKNDFFAFSSREAPKIVVIDEAMTLLPSTILKEIRYAAGVIQIGSRLGVIPDLKTLAHDVF
ncbi:MAG: hypothetical protein GKR95_19500 [Gammaproteobacteria bacterium]|nr:hypothetical protein [Gammaproteobacteria bacterium]